MFDDTISARVARVLEQRLALDTPPADLDLFASGLIDSLAFVDLLVGLEREFDIHFAVDDLDLDRFRTLRALTEVVAHAVVTAEPAVERA
jgi:acyl carrier protein